MWKLLLKKFGMSFLVALVYFVGLFCYGLVLFPINLPYLLKISAEADYLFAMIFALIFVCVATVRVRAKWCLEEDMFFAHKDEKAPPLIRRVVSSQEFLADVIVFAVWALVPIVFSGVTSGAPWHSVVVGILMLSVGSIASFALLDCLLYVISRRKADKQLRKREEA